MTQDHPDEMEAPPSPPSRQRLNDGSPENARTLTEDIRQSNNKKHAIVIKDDHQVSVDFVEWWCHRLIMSDDVLNEAAANASTDRNTTTAPKTTPMTELNDGFRKALNNLDIAKSDMPEFGRLKNRLQIVGLCLEVAALPISKESSYKERDLVTIEETNAHATNQDESDESKGEDGETNNVRRPGSLEELVTLVKEEFILLKSMLLRKDANVDALMMVNGVDSGEPPQPDAAPDVRLEKNHPLFAQDYPRVAKQLKVATICAQFYQRLQGFVQAEMKDDVNVNDGQKSHKQQVRQAVDDYESKLKQVFFGNLNNIDSDDEEDSTEVKQLPNELIGFLLKDLYQKRRGSMASTCSTASAGSLSPTATGDEAPPSSLASRLLGHVESLLFNDDTTKRYSMRATQRALRELLRGWHGLVLEQPNLVKLGYGRDESNDGDNISRRQAEAEEDDMLRRLSSTDGAENPNNHGVFTMEALDDDDDISEVGDHPNDSQETHPSTKKSGSTANLMDSSSSDESTDGNNNEKKRKFVPIAWVDSSDESNSDDVEVSPYMYSPNKKEAHRRVYGDSASKAKAAVMFRPLTEEEYESILEGVKHYGFGRWRMIQANDPHHRLDHMELDQMRDAYYQQIHPNHELDF